MGTRFMLTREAPVHDAIKQAILRGSERDTNVIFKPFKNTARVFRNAVSDEVLARQSRPGAVFEDVRPLVAGARGRAALESGDTDGGLLWAGQAIGLMEDLPSCAELIPRIVAECRAALARASLLAN